MADEKFDLVFRGELVPGADLGQVKQNLARLFKMDPARIERLFSGKAVVLKRGMEMDAAAKYRIAIKKAGARIDTLPTRVDTPLVDNESVSPQAKPVQTAAGAPVAPEAAAQPPLPEVSEVDAEAPKQSSGSLFSLAPVGDDLLRPEERQQEAPAKTYMAEFSLRPASGALVDEGEVVRPEPVAVGAVDFDVAPAGTDVLKPEERQAPVEVNIDLSQLSVAPPGERLEAPKPAPPPAPDVSRFSTV